MSFAATLEFGFSSRTGRTLELTGAVTAHVHAQDLPKTVAFALDVVARLDAQLALDGVGPQHTVAWARGVLERIRIQGGMSNARGAQRCLHTAACRHPQTGSQASSPTVRCCAKVAVSGRNVWSVTGPVMGFGFSR